MFASPTLKQAEMKCTCSGLHLGERPGAFQQNSEAIALRGFMRATAEEHIEKAVFILAKHLRATSIQRLDMSQSFRIRLKIRHFYLSSSSHLEKVIHAVCASG